MWSLDEIKARNAAAGKRARATGVNPYLLRDQEQLEEMPPFPFPVMGDAAEKFDKEYPRVDCLLVDTTGVGKTWELALTTDQLVPRLRELLEEYGPVYLAFVGVGPFQAHLGVWKKGKDR